MINSLLVLFLSLSAFAIIPGVKDLGHQNQVLKLQFLRFGVSQGGICTGTAIGKNRILTAGHCVKRYIESRPRFLKLKINDKNYSISKIETPSKYIELQKKYDEKIRNKKPFGNELRVLSRIDLAVIVLRRNLKKDIIITKLKLSKSPNSEAILCGYGYSLYRDDIYSGNKTGDLLCGHNNFFIDSSYLFIEGNVFNASPSSSMTAPGDSGSPLFDKDMNQIGVLSGITKNDQGDATSYYAAVFRLPSFFRTHLN